MALRPLAYTIESSTLHNERRHSARFECGGGCGAVLAVPLKVGNTNPELIAKLAVQEGWSTDAFRASRTRCPVCKRGKRKGHDAESEILAFQRKQAQNGATETPMQEPSVGTPETGADETAPVEPKAALPPTPAQRAAVRRMLEERFDVEAGEYPDGQSDEAIAAEAGVDPALVTLIRDAGYGPILVTEAMREMRRRRDALVAEAAAVEADATAKATEMRERVDQEIARMLSAASDQSAGLLRQATELDEAFEDARNTAQGGTG